MPFALFMDKLAPEAGVDTSFFSISGFWLVNDASKFVEFILILCHIKSRHRVSRLGQCKAFFILFGIVSWVNDENMFLKFLCTFLLNCCRQAASLNGSTPMRAIWTCAVTVRYYESSINRSIRLGSGWEFLGTCNRSRAFFVRDSAFQESHSKTNSSKAQSKVALHTFRKSYHASQSCQAPCIMCQFTHFLLIVQTVY